MKDAFEKPKIMLKEKNFNFIKGEEEIDGIFYKFRAEIKTTNLSWKENRPYGLGSVYEDMGEEVIEDIDIIELSPETNDKKVIRKIKKNIEKKFYER